jgi:hypothetical protein
VSQWDRILQRVPDGQSDHNIRFSVLRGLLKRLNFDERKRGDHHSFGKDGVREIIDLQPQKDGKAKAYQVRQVRAILMRYGLTRVP